MNLTGIKNPILQSGRTILDVFTPTELLKIFINDASLEVWCFSVKGWE